MSPREPKTAPLRVVRGAPDVELVGAPNGRHAGLAMVCNPAESLRRLQEMQAFVKLVMVPGEDFMTIPGTPKPTLLQPGAQKLAELYGLAARFVAHDEVLDWQDGFFYFAVRCILTSRVDGSFVGEGLGSSNSRESKHAQRWLQRKDVPTWVDVATLPTKELPSKFAGGKPYTVFQVPNEDPYSIVNTLQKMAAKRSYVHGVLSVTRSSGLFTQDREDLPPDVYGTVEEERPWERGAAPEAAAPADVVHRDVKPANVRVPAVDIGTNVPKSKGEADDMSPKEQATRDRFGPLFASSKSGDELRRHGRDASKEVGGLKASKAYLRWHTDALRRARGGSPDAGSTR